MNGGRKVRVPSVVPVEAEDSSVVGLLQDEPMAQR
jgi:hypothetical protein